MPNPRKDESKDDYLQRCMGDKETLSKYPDESQRYAVCNSLWKEDKIKSLSSYRQTYAEQTYNDYPKKAVENAKIALRYAEENGWGTCLEATGKARANQLANREKITRDTIARMAAFERHRKNSQKELGDGCGRLAWLAWGGDEGIEWAQRKLEQIDK